MSKKLRSQGAERGLDEEKPKAPRRRKVQPTNRRATKQEPAILTPELDNPRDIDTHIVPYDENLLERARTQWQFGDWESLAALDRNTLQHHPDRAKLALLAAAGNLQTNNTSAAKQFIRLAQDWGCSKKLISQILVSGVHNSLGRAAATAGQQPRALKHFESAIAIGTPGSEVRLITQARMGEQITQLGLLGGTLQLAAGQSTSTVPPIEDIVDQQRQRRMQSLAENCVAAADVHAAVDAELSSGALDAEEAFVLCVALSDEFKMRDDKLTAAHFLNTAREYVDEHDSHSLSSLPKRLIATGQIDEALDILVSRIVSDADLSAAEKKYLGGSYAKARASVRVKEEHGHEVLLAYLRSHEPQAAGGRNPVLIEIGSTRENVRGQGSTRIIAEYCRSANMNFITVDMDPHNTTAAATMFRGLGVGFQAINAMGEDYLREYAGDMDFVFLDAYDFDHGKHSELRQSRYKKYIGSSIDEVACHEMHLDCARSVHEKLSAVGLVCIDDAWLVDGKWCAKGTLAVPYLLAHDFEILEARNRAVLLRRKNHGG